MNGEILEQNRKSNGKEYVWQPYNAAIPVTKPGLVFFISSDKIFTVGLLIKNCSVLLEKMKNVD